MDVAGTGTTVIVMGPALDELVGATYGATDDEEVNVASGEVYTDDDELNSEDELDETGVGLKVGEAFVMNPVERHLVLVDPDAPAGTVLVPLPYP